MLPAHPLPVAVLISGAGSNMAALIDAGLQPGAPFRVTMVISNRPEAAGLDLARAKGVDTIVLNHRAYRDRISHEMALDAALVASGAQLVALAGYMRLLTPWLVGRWAGRMLNIHPSLLPLYPGLDTHARAIAAGDAEAGCSVHWVTEGVDDGPLLGQARCPILKDDTPGRLAERVKVLEHRLYPECLARAARDSMPSP